MRNCIIAILGSFSLLSSTATGQQQQTNQSCPLVAQTQLDNGLSLRDVANLENSTITLQLIYEGQAWLGLGPSANGKMVGANAVIGLPDEANSQTNPGLYQMTATSDSGVNLYGSFYQTLQNASIEQNDTHTVLTFTSWLLESDQLFTISPTNYSTWIYAVGRSNAFPAEHAIKGSITFLFTPCGSTNTTIPTLSGGGLSSTHKKWIAHGVLMAVAWGILAPIAIGASLLRDGLDRMGFAKGTWFAIHRTCNILVVLSTIAGFWIAYVNIEKEDAEHFEIRHMKVGLAIFILVLVQAIVAFGRPSLPHHGHAADKTPADEGEPQEGTTSPAAAADGAASDDHPAASLSTTHHKKSLIRVIWEYKHRVFGLGLLGLSWYNCDTGFAALVEEYGDSDDKTAAFWGVAVGITGLVIVLTIVLRLVP